MNSEKKRKTADLLTICIKAGRAVKGFDSSMDAVRDGKAFCVLTAAVFILGAVNGGIG